jgi:hypothetical protein
VCGLKVNVASLSNIVRAFLNQNAVLLAKLFPEINMRAVTDMHQSLLVILNLCTIKVLNITNYNYS